MPPNAQFVVHYSAVTPIFDSGTKPDGGLIALGATLRLRQRGGAEVDSAVEVQRGSGHYTPTAVALRPRSSLEPGRTYELVDGLVQVPCGGHYANACALGTPVVLASYLVAGEPDVNAPSFGGLNPIDRREPHVCGSDACCGPFRTWSITFTWSAGNDDRAGDSVLYNLYAADDLSRPIQPLVEGTSFRANRPCFTSADPFLPLVLASKVVVRAVDWAGNEDGNSIVRDTNTDCSVLEGYAGAPDASAREMSDAAPDLVGPFDTKPPLDSGAPADIDSRAAEGEAGPFTREDGCTCRVGGSKGRGSVAIPLLVSSGALLMRRRRRAPDILQQPCSERSSRGC